MIAQQGRTRAHKKEGDYVQMFLGAVIGGGVDGNTRDDRILL